ncbi:cytochrome c peroxidase [Dyadobacter fermentans]|uniref:Cytochrome-c peroxidase n=1 Tax=Dyadobacter fermentans (strain ATCC 700827 / DSM 18053 / CIP 107007 / KCTC 52180 / NS114) TaxID=471854 RepID=C6W095_DYAFD|nr:cytochrome c peroxidase [Dyadobacter fermentans]ACT91829.1 Cytochrome-c peroxidase [Dyadobacter fermentans DSM 18053]
MLKFTRNPNSFIFRHRRLLFSLFLIIIIPLIVCLIWWLTEPDAAPARQVKTTFMQDVTGLDSAVSRLQTDIRARRPAAIQASFRDARLAYKRVEFISAYYSPETTRALNGPNIPEVDDDLRVNEPQSFQVLEEMVFPEVATDAYPDMLHAANVIRANVNRLRRISESNELTDSHIFDAMRLEVFRIVSMGITGFDSPVAFHSLPEVAAALESMQRQFRHYTKTNDGPAAQLHSAFDAALAYIRKSPDFDAFDRLEFIRHYANPLSSSVIDAQKALGIPVFTEKRLLSTSARTLTDSGAFDANYFINFEEQSMTSERIALGKMLFFNPILSNNSGRTCATCHQPDKAFTDGEPKSFALGFNGMRISRNAPTLLNASFQAAQFADSRVTFLEDQASDVIRNPQEMHGSLPDAVAALRNEPESRKLFEEAYSDGVTESNLKNAIASYIRSLSSLDTRLDRHFRGDETLLTAEEKSGFNLFMGKAKCATCHFFPLFNGTVPPAYQETESEVLGTPATAEGKSVDPDVGKFVLTKREPHRYAFKTPTVRHVALTAPYMHNGVFKTLEEVVDFYDQGGGNGLGFNLENQTLPFDKLNLTVSEKKALVAFMKIL